MTAILISTRSALTAVTQGQRIRYQYYGPMSRIPRLRAGPDRHIHLHVTRDGAEFDTATVTGRCQGDHLQGRVQRTGYDGNDGTVPWSSDWVTSGGSGPLIGERRVDADGAELYVLMFDDSTPGEYVERTADFSLLASPELTFDYRQHFVTPAIGFEVQVSEDGSTWTPVWSLWGSGSDAAYVPVTVDLSAFSADPTIVRFTHIAGTPAGFIFHVDNVQIAEASNLSPVAIDDADGTPRGHAGHG